MLEPSVVRNDLQRRKAGSYQIAGTHALRGFVAYIMSVNFCSSFEATFHIDYRYVCPAYSSVWNVIDLRTKSFKVRIVRLGADP